MFKMLKPTLVAIAALTAGGLAVPDQAQADVGVRIGRGGFGLYIGDRPGPRAAYRPYRGVPVYRPPVCVPPRHHRFRGGYDVGRYRPRDVDVFVVPRHRLPPPYRRW